MPDGQARTGSSVLTPEAERELNRVFAEIMQELHPELDWRPVEPTPDDQAADMPTVVTEAVAPVDSGRRE